MKLSLAPLLLLGALAQAAPAPAPVTDAADLEKRATVWQFKYKTPCHSAPWRSQVTVFDAGSYIQCNCYHWQDGNQYDIWYYTKYGCWVSNISVGGPPVPGLPPC